MANFTVLGVVQDWWVMKSHLEFANLGNMENHSQFWQNPNTAHDPKITISQ